MSVVYLKGLTTRYKNLLSAEIKKAEQLLTATITDFDYEPQIRKVNTSYNRLCEFGPKLEDTLEKLSLAIEDAKSSEELKKFQDQNELFFNLLTEISSRKDELKSLEIELTKRHKEMTHMEGDQRLDRLIDLQSQMLQQMQIQQQEREVQRKTDNAQINSVNLPKLEIISYSGDKQKFHEFWDQFDCTIHKNPRLSNIEKFTYLKSRLFGIAQSAISGLALTTENYNVAVGILEERFGDKQAAVDSHYIELINLQSATNRTFELRVLYDKIERNLRSLEALGQNIDQEVFISMITSKLPRDVMIQLEIQKGTGTKWTVATLRELLKGHIQARESAESHSRQDKPNEPKPHAQAPSQFAPSRFRSPPTNQFKPRGSAEALVANTQDRSRGSEMKKLCIYCKGDHWSDECTAYRTVEERKKQLAGLCYVCLKSGHRLQDCKSDRKCVYCGKTKKHHRSLCLKRFLNNEVANVVEESAEVPNTESNLLSSGDIVLMQTAQTVLSNVSNTRDEKTRILLDCGSQRTYITETLAKRLMLKTETVEEISVVTFGSEKSKIVKTAKVALQIKLADGTFMKIYANVVPRITGSICRKPISIEQSQNWEYLWSNFKLADTLPTEQETSTIELLIGNDYYLDVILPEKFEIQPGLYLLGSKLGWLVTGRTAEQTERRDEYSMLIMNCGIQTQPLPESYCITSVDQSLPVKPPIEDFWNLETIGIRECDEVISDDAKALNDFNNSVKFENGRYYVAWPWKNEHCQLPDNKDVSYGRFRSLLYRLKNKPELFKKYCDTIDDQLKLGVIEKVEPGDDKDMTIMHYIPHHPVVDPTKPTKVRIVYDASAKSKCESPSLNECMYRGPVLLKDLCGLLMRFRMYRLAVIADIEKAFLQLGLRTGDRDATRFYWIKDRTLPLFDINNVQTYRFCRVPFGVVASPFLLAATVDLHLQKYDTVTARKVKDNIYVDNVITGADSLDEIRQLYSESKRMFTDASMNLRDWCSNSAEFMKEIPETDKDKRETVKVLGMQWNVPTDKMTISSPKFTAYDMRPTKREILQSIASVFDPLGLCAPVTLLGKLFLQTLWNKQLEWDEKISEDDNEIWTEIANDLKQLHTVSIDRCVGISETQELQLLCFSDASTKAYACAIYLRQVNNDMCRTDLIFSKTRIAPVKQLSIPRLELLAVVIGLRCLAFVKQQLKAPVKNTILWTDSQCVIHWIASDKKVDTFVDNRLREIRRNRDIDIRYVSSQDNPADIASRGIHVTELKAHPLWWNGPSWLMSSEEEWPKWSYNHLKEQQSVECFAGEPPKGSFSVQIENLDKPFGIDYEKYSSFMKLLRVTAWIMRFIRKLKKESVSGPLTAKEIDQARNRWISYMQRKHFSNEIELLKKNKTNNLIRQLGLTVDNNSRLIRCTGRLEYAEITDDAKRPILIPKKDTFTNLIVNSFHCKLFHVGVAQTLSQIRQCYWIPSGRFVVRNVLRKCKSCIRWEGGPYKMPLFPPLPSKRVSESVPYTYTGIDYFGPLYVKTDNEPRKVWVCLFTCLVVRAIHLELMQDMSTEQFLLGFRRFIARCGTPKQIISDNAMQFKAASAVVKQEWTDVISDRDTFDYVSNRGIEWKFIVELAPWMGGYYERLVGLVKRSLRKTMGRSLFTVEQLLTLLIEIEAVVNSRPLVYIGDDISSQTVLTPSCFLTPNKSIGIPEEIIDSDPDFKPQMSSKDNLLQIWKKGQKHLNRFWQIWKCDYLLSLRERTSTHLKQNRKRSTCEPKIGEIVLIKDDLPRGNWKLGKIVELYTSFDGQTRSAKVLLPTKRCLNRTLNFLYPLECEELNIDEESTETAKSDIEPTKDNEIKPTRRAAARAREKIKQWTSDP